MSPPEPITNVDSLPIFVLRIVSPAVVALAASSLFFVKPPAPVNQEQSGSRTPSITSVVVASRVPRNGLILALLTFAGLSALADGLTFVVYAVLSKYWDHASGIDIGSVLGLAGFLGLAALGAWKEIHGVQVWFLKRIRISTFIALALDIALVVLLGLPLRDPNANKPRIPEYSLHVPLNLILHFIFPAFRVLVLFILFITLLSPHVVYEPVPLPEEEAATQCSYLLPESANAQSSGLSPHAQLPTPISKYGTFRSNRSSFTLPPTRATTPSPSTTKIDPKPEIALDPSWKELGRRIRRITPYLWPSSSRSLQLLAGLCVVIVLIGRFVNAVVPFLLAKIVEVFEEGSKVSPWPYLFGYVGLRFLQGSGGLAAIRDYFWTPVMQYSDRQMSQLSFDHILNLSFAFHTRRKTGEILRILDRGAAINHTFELLLFSIIPTFIDIIVALVVFCIAFEWTLGVVIFVVMFCYVASSVILTRWRTKLRRQMTDRDVITRGIHTDCLLNYETVKYFGGEEHEGERYRRALGDYQAMEYKVIVSLNLLNLIQNFIITMGLLVGAMIVAYRVTNGQSKPSEFVFFISYLAQLYGPLNSLGTIYRSVNQSLVDTERLLKLLSEPTEINDKPDAEDLIVDNGEIEFDNVSFSYDGRTTALNGVSFKVPKGSSVALVGESGSGKSTILRLLYRFYDLQEGQGRILIDGKDIRDVTQVSLRKSIGVIPQDSVLFNSSIGYNIGYGKFGASQEEIEEAAAKAQMHDRVMGFPDRYETVVGERGVRLSGGEKQRVAIARTLLKNPPILLLDEATSALDSSTEKDIQKALQTLQHGRSSLAIAHRLSTIASADIILVLKDGQIVEQGSRLELVARNGVFASMYRHDESLQNPDVDAASTSTATKDAGKPAEAQPDLDNQEQEPTLAGDGHSIHAPTIPAESDLSYAQVVADKPSTHDQEPPAPSDTPAAAPVTFPSSSEAEEAPQPVAFPLSDEPEPISNGEAAAKEEKPLPTAPAPAPVAFPGSADDASSVVSPAQPPPNVGTPGVTFDTSRTGTPDHEGEPKRKPTATQNFQRLARRISLTTRRQGSSSSIIPNIPNLMRRDTKEPTPRGSDDVDRSDSPAGSLTGKDKKKEKKERRKSVHKP